MARLSKCQPAPRGTRHDLGLSASRLSFLRRKPHITQLIKSAVERITNHAVTWHLPPAGNGHLAVTFDDGPLPNTLNILSLLDKYRLAATFFMIGKNVVKHHDIAREVQNRGHAIGSHTMNHPNLKQLSFSEFRDEIVTSIKIFEEYLGIRPNMFRPPMGMINLIQIMWLLKKRMNIIFSYHGLIEEDHDVIRMYPYPNSAGPVILLHDYDDPAHIETILKLAAAIRYKKTIPFPMPLKNAEIRHFLSFRD